MINRTVLVAAAILAIVVSCPSIQAQHGQAAVEKPRFTIAISAKFHTVKSGSKIAIQIAMTNTSDRPMYLQGQLENYGYMVDVTQEDGSAAPDTDRGREWKNTQGTGGSVSAPAEPLNPSRTEKGQLVISDLYDMSRPGKYSIRVRRGSVMSNAITVTVIP